jgi:uncharacterized membrane protein
MEQNRFKSPVVWASLAATVALILKSWCGWEIPNFEVIITSVLGVLVGFGILNNPEKKDGF